MEIKSVKKHFYHVTKNDQIKKSYRTSEVSFSHIPQNEYSCIEVGFMNDTEIQNGNSKRLRLYFRCFLTTETRTGTADVA